MGKFLKSRIFAMVLCLGLSMAFLTNVQLTHGTLGESGDSVVADQKALSAVKCATTFRPNYTVHEFKSDGTTIREYVSPSGVVFGIAWNGLTHPDLKLLLGSYAGEYEAALKRIPPKPGISRNARVETGRLVVEKWGQMRNLQGQAYAPDLVPPGVSADEIR